MFSTIRSHTMYYGSETIEIRPIEIRTIEIRTIEILIHVTTKPQLALFLFMLSIIINIKSPNLKIPNLNCPNMNSPISIVSEPIDNCIFASGTAMR